MNSSRIKVCYVPSVIHYPLVCMVMCHFERKRTFARYEQRWMNTIANSAAFSSSLHQKGCYNPVHVELMDCNHYVPLLTPIACNGIESLSHDIFGVYGSGNRAKFSILLKIFPSRSHAYHIHTELMQHSWDFRFIKGTELIGLQGISK